MRRVALEVPVCKQRLQCNTYEYVRTLEIFIDKAWTLIRNDVNINNKDTLTLYQTINKFLNEVAQNVNED